MNLGSLLEQERRLQRGVAGRVTAPVDALFDLLEESTATLHSQAEALEAAGRALEDAARLMKSQAELFDRTLGPLRAPTEFAKSIAGLEPHSRPGKER